MDRSFSVRVERANRSFEDITVGGDGMHHVRDRAEHLLKNNGHQAFDWRGYVVFVDGARPAEERTR